MTMNEKQQAISVCAAHWAALTVSFLTVLLVFAAGSCGPTPEPGSLLVVSYDPTREMFEELNAAFAARLREQTGDAPAVYQSHAASGTQARAVMQGLEADVVNLVLAWDVDMISSRSGKIDPDWRTRLPYGSSPFSSTIVFLVRKGNPLGIEDWDDLAEPGVTVVAPNPKTSGGARWIYVAAYGYALDRWGTEEAAIDFLAGLYGNAPVLDAGARGSTITFVKRGIGDVLLAWENEAHLAIDEVGAENLEIVTPSFSVLAEPVVAAVDEVVERHGSRALVDTYLHFLYSREGQEIIARNYFRPRDAEVGRKYADRFAPVRMLDVGRLFESWDEAQSKHFADGGVFDRIYQPGDADAEHDR